VSRLGAEDAGYAEGWWR